MPAKRYCVADPEAALIDRLILDQVTVGSRVLDLGCGDGRLLCRLRDERGCSIQGIELDHARVVEAIHKGVPVLQADLDEGLDEVPDASFDFAILSQTLQQVLKPQDLLLQMLRVAGKIEPVFVESIEDMPRAILSAAQDGDVVITMGAGSIGGVPGKLVSGEV